MTRPPAAILDIDGTLVDTNYHHAVAWFQEHRATHPEEDKPVVNEGDSVGWKTLAADPT